jgi:hypothetical protein
LIRYPKTPVESAGVFVWRKLAMIEAIRWLELEKNLVISVNVLPRFCIVFKPIDLILGNLYVTIAGKRLFRPILIMFMVAPGKPAKDNWSLD